MSQDYDKDLINREVIAVCDHYLTDRKGEGKRQTYLCPACGDRNFEVDPDRGYAGCFDAGCEAPTTTDALGVLAYFEGKSLSGEGFVMCLKKGYEILGIADPQQQRSEPTNGARQKAMTARKQRKGSQREKAMTPRADRGGEDEMSGNGHNGVHSSGPQWGAATSSPVETSTSALAEQPIQAWQENEDGTTVPVAAVVIREPETEPEAEAEDGAELEDAELAEQLDRQTDRTDERQTAHEVFEELLKLCRREERDESFLVGRGLDEETIKGGHFGSISKSRCNYVVGKLRKKFSEEELLAVPGFHRTEGGQLRFSLYGDYALIPYFDNEGYIRTVEGRFTGEEMGEYDKKYKALLHSAVHLYVHPRFNPDEVVAICEGAIGAMVAARYGFAVASIKGFRNYRRRVDGDGNLYAVLPELEGVDFAGKVVVYIPDVDVKPASYESVMKAVPDACHWMIERQGGVPKVAMLPEGAKDLDAWILSLDEDEREEKMEELLGGTIPVEQFEAEYLITSEGEQEQSQPEFEELGGGVSGAEGSPEGDPDSPDGDSTEEDSSAESKVDTGGNSEAEEGYEESGGKGKQEHREQPTGEDETARMASEHYETGAGTSEGEDPGWQQLQLPTDESTTGEDTTEEGGEEDTDQATEIEVRQPQAWQSQGDATEEQQIPEAGEEPEQAETQPPSVAAYHAHLKGERHLAVLVYVMAALVLSVVVWLLIGGWLNWYASFVAGAGLALPVALGFSRLAAWHNERRLRRHIEGN